MQPKPQRSKEDQHTRPRHGREPAVAGECDVCDTWAARLQDGLCGSCHGRFHLKRSDD